MTCMGRWHQGTLDSPTAKIMAVLDAVARLANAPVSLVAEHTGLPASTAYRICVELERLLLQQVRSRVRQPQLQRAPSSHPSRERSVR